MTQPIQSSLVGRDLSDEETQGAGDALLCNPEPLLTASRPLSPDAQQELEPAVQRLVNAFSTAPPAPTAGPSEAALGSADTNAGRTTARSSTEPYFSAGETRNGSAFAGAAALKSHDTSSGVEAEVFSASAQVGAQNEAQVALARIGYAGGERLRFGVAVETLSSRANAGVSNDDGSEGANLGVGATAVGAEATIAYSGWSITAGAAISAGFAVSSGERNIDGDDVPERCFKGSIGFATLGVCTEL